MMCINLKCKTAYKKKGHAFMTPRFTQIFAERFGIVSRAFAGKHHLRPTKTAFLEKQLAFDLVVLAGEFRSGELEEDNIENADETHFLIDVDNWSTLGFPGESEVKYAEAFSGREGMAMFVPTSGGRDAKIEALFMVFKNANKSFPIRGIPDDVPGVSYRSVPKGWMDTTVMPRCRSEVKVLKRLSHDRKRVLHVDNCSGHNSTPQLIEAVNSINTEPRYFEPNLTDYVQPRNSFIIQKMKSEWSVEWERYKMKAIMDNNRLKESGKVPNPCEKFFLELAVRAVNRFNSQREAMGYHMHERIWY